jgi:hypothetical protein
MLRQSHLSIARHNPLPLTEIAKKGKDLTLPLFYSRNANKVGQPYLVFVSSFVSGAFSGAGVASFEGSPAF